MVEFILLILGLVVLVKGADVFVENASLFARSLGISAVVIGLTIVAFGTSAPELAISLIAAFNGNGSIAISNAIGSNICNILLVLGSSCLFCKLVCDKIIIGRDYKFCILLSILLCLFMSSSLLNNNKLGFVCCFCLFLVFVIYIIKLFKDANKEDSVKDKIKFDYKYLIIMVVGIAMVIIGGEIVVNSATSLAKIIGMSDRFIGLTVVAIGTSLPELVTSVVACRKGEVDIAIGNVIGSCIFNVGLIIGLAGMIHSMDFSISMFIDSCFMVSCIVISYLIVKYNKCIDKKYGILFLIMYFLYLIYLVLSK